MPVQVSRLLSRCNVSSRPALTRGHHVRAVNRVVEISDSGRAPKNDPAIFALALVVTHGDARAKAHAFSTLGKVCRISTHLFHFGEHVNAK